MVQYPAGFGQWLCALDFYLSPPKEIALIGRPEDPGTKSLMRVIKQRYLPNMVLAGSSPDKPDRDTGIPLLRDREMIDNRATAYLCEGNVCPTP